MRAFFDSMKGGEQTDKVRILDRCEFCQGEAYLFVSEDVDSRGDTFDRYRPCVMCHGSGNQPVGYFGNISDAKRV